MSSEPRTVELPAHVYARVEDRLHRTEFDSVDAYVAYAMEEVLFQVESATADEHDPTDEEEIERRLKSLGYLD